MSRRVSQIKLDLLKCIIRSKSHAFRLFLRLLSLSLSLKVAFFGGEKQVGGCEDYTFGKVMQQCKWISVRSLFQYVQICHYPQKLLTNLRSLTNDFLRCLKDSDFHKKI